MVSGTPVLRTFLRPLRDDSGGIFQGLTKVLVFPKFIFTFTFTVLALVYIPNMGSTGKQAFPLPGCRRNVRVLSKKNLNSHQPESSQVQASEMVKHQKMGVGKETNREDSPNSTRVLNI